MVLFKTQQINDKITLFQPKAQNCLKVINLVVAKQNGNSFS